MEIIMSKDLPLLPTIIIEKAFTSEEVKFIRSTVLSDPDTKLKEYIHDWEGPHQNKKMSERYIFNPNKLTQNSFNILMKLSDIIKDSGEEGSTFELDIFEIEIHKMIERQKDNINAI